MIAYSRDISTAKAQGIAVRGIIFAAILAIFSPLALNFFSVGVSLLYVPLIAIYLWPCGAANIVSICFIFLLGIFVDFISDGPVGLWSFIYLSLFIFMRPDMRNKSHMSGEWVGFVMCLLIVNIMILFIGWITARGAIIWDALLIQSIVACVAFPPVFTMRKLARRLTSFDDGADM